MDDASVLLVGSATVAADAIAHRTVTAVELVQAALDRIDAVNPAVNAMVELRREQALAEAAAADAAIAAGEQVVRLHGVPVTVKEALAVAGMHRTWGDPNAADSISGEAAVAVDRLQHAGAIVLGTTNVAYGLADFAQTHNDLYGTTNNPWDTNRAAGGSSGGSAAALATGMSMLEIGSDLVGSVRIPASFCGVYGLRPSVGIVPTQGLLPPGAHPSPPEREIISTVGPMARSAADLRTALLAMAGPLPPEGRAWTWALPRPRCRRLHESRVSVVLDDGCAPVSAEVGDVLSDAVDALARSGATIVEGWPEGFDPAQSVEAFGFQVGLFIAAHEPAGNDFASLSAVLDQERRRLAFRATWDRHFNDVDVMLLPTTVTAAIAHDARRFDERTIVTSAGDVPYTDQTYWISHAALPGLPALSAPVGQTSEGLPVGVQVIGPALEDDTAITFAALLADITPGYRPPPLPQAHR